MNDFIAAQDRALLEQHGLASFDALWALQLEAVDESNTERGGWSSVYRLELGDRAYYLKRQSNHLTRSLWHPLGEPTFAREFRNIRRYAELGPGRLEGSGSLAAAMGRAGRSRAWRHPARLRWVGAPSAQGRAGARLFLSQAHLPACARRCIRCATDRSGEDPAIAAGAA